MRNLELDYLLLPVSAPPIPDIAAVAASCDLGSDGLGVVRRCEQVHQVSRSLLVGFLFKSHVEVGGLPEHIQERPEREPPRSIGFKAEIDPKPICACGLYRWRGFRQV